MKAGGREYDLPPPTRDHGELPAARVCAGGWTILPAVLDGTPSAVAFRLLWPHAPQRTGRFALLSRSPAPRRSRFLGKNRDRGAGLCFSGS
jgi:hypothetical protein